MPDLSATSAQVAAALKRRASAATLAVPTVARCWLEHNLPQAAALLLRVGRDARRATVAAVVGLPPGMVGSALTRSQVWLEPGVALGRIRRYGDPPALAASIRLPKRLARHACWSVPLSGDPGAINLLLVLTPSSADAIATRRALRRAVKVLEPIASAQTHSFGETHPAINAKRQWEITVDLLPEVICLVDRERQVLRINRTIETWGISSVQDALGVELHHLLHPQCHASTCSLRRALDEVWRRPSRGVDATVRVTDPLLARTFDLTVRRIDRASVASGLSPVVRAICLVADVTDLSAAQLLLRRLNTELEARVEERTNDLRRANEELKSEIGRREAAERSLLDSRNELSLLSVELMHAQERERKRISQELHDAVGQSLSAVKYTLERSVHLLEHPHLGNVRDALEIAVSQVHRAVADVRAISSSLRPPLLDDLGAVSAIRGFCREWAGVYPHIKVDTQLKADDADIPSHLALSVFRIVQESMNNIAKHSGAAAVRVALGIEAGRLSVEVRDDGVGFSSDDRNVLRRRGSGWRGMRERAEHDGGRLRIRSRPGEGVSLRVEWPLDRTGEGVRAPPAAR